MFSTSSATVHRTIGNKGFGFVRTLHDEVEIDIFVHEDRLKDSGFKPEDFKVDLVVGLQFEPTKDHRFRAVRILKIGGVSARMPASVDQFINALRASENLDTGEVLWRIMTKEGELVQYLVADDGGLVIRQLGHVTSNKARADIGLPEKAPKARVASRSRKEPPPQPVLLAAE